MRFSQKKQKINTRYQIHPYHIVDPSPWPLLTAISLLLLALGGFLFFSYQQVDIVFYAALLVASCLACWFRDVIREATFTQHHTKPVQQNLRLGFILFIISEVMFFLGFFWAFFHSSLAPTHIIGCVWPPAGIIPFQPFQIPFFNTAVLLSSGAAITIVHHLFNRKARFIGYETHVNLPTSADSIFISLFATRKQLINLFFSVTIGLALIFTLVQIYEYSVASFSISDGIFGSTFYLLTGFHGLHVIIGTIFILVSFFRQVQEHFSITNHFGFEAAAWYWHFVDVVWLFLYIFLYYWTSL